jgi:hypothetical protein
MSARAYLSYRLILRSAMKIVFGAITLSRIRTPSSAVYVTMSGIMHDAFLRCYLSLHASCYACAELPFVFQVWIVSFVARAFFRN